MILNFQPQMKPPILALTKIHSIRLDKHDRWKPGMKIHFATGARTKNYNNFLLGRCVSIQKISMLFDNEKLFDHITIDGRTQLSAEIQQLARNDGFKNYRAFQEWFINMYGEIFVGKIIHWTFYRYSGLNYIRQDTTMRLFNDEVGASLIIPSDFKQSNENHAYDALRYMVHPQSHRWTLKFKKFKPWKWLLIAAALVAFTYLFNLYYYWIRN